MFARARRSGISIQIAPMSSTKTLWVRPGISARTRPITIDVGCLSDGIIVVTRTLKIIIDNNDGACARDDDRLDALDYVCVCVQLLYAHFIIPVVCGGGLRATSNTAKQPARVFECTQHKTHSTYVSKHGICIIIMHCMHYKMLGVRARCV